MTPDPAVSIIMPCFNGERFIGRAIDSVLAQTVRDWELLVVDDGSDDRSRDIVCGYGNRDRRVVLMEHDGGARRGVSRSRNLAVARARGRLLAFLDADDEWLPEKLAVQIDALRRCPEAALVYCRAQCVDREGRAVVEPGPFHVWGVIGTGTPGIVAGAYEKFLGLRIGVPTTTVMARREPIVETGGFPEDISVGEDSVVWARIMRSHPIFFVPEVLSLYRLHAGSCLGGMDPVARVDSAWRYYTHIAQSREDRDAVLVRMLLSFMARFMKCVELPVRERWQRARAAGHELLAEAYCGRARVTWRLCLAALGYGGRSAWWYGGRIMCSVQKKVRCSSTVE